MKHAAPILIPDNWDDLTDAEKDAATAELLKAAADEAGVDRRGSTAGTGQRSRRTRSPKT